jgi:hypothetical protein
MIDEERLERYLLLSGLTELSLVALRPKYRRWIVRLHKQGLPVPAALNDDPQACNLVNLLVHQTRPERNPKVEHHLRNATGVRPYKL